MGRNIIFFGGAGEGKSSCINLLAGGNVAGISANADGCTLENTMHEVTLNGEMLQLWDTAGLNEHEGGRVPHRQAIVQLYRLFRELEAISLLVFVMRAPRLKDSAQPNWKLFYEIVGQEQVPIIVVVTGLELEEGSMDDWWDRNWIHFYEKDIWPHGYACVTAARGPSRNGDYLFGPEYDESMTKLANVITRTALQQPWRYEERCWFREMVEIADEYIEDLDYFGTDVFTWEVEGAAIEQLRQHCGLSQMDAEDLGRTFAAIDAGR